MTSVRCLELLLVSVLLAAGLLCSCNAQYELCDLTAGSTAYDLPTTTAQTGTAMYSGLVFLPSPYVEAYVNFCNPATTPCGEGVYLCITGKGASKPFPLCNSRPTGDFITPASPQLGAYFSCDNKAGNITRGIVSSVAHGSRTSDGQHPSEVAAHPVCVYVSVFVCACVSDVVLK
jgi:hypothetical protein